MIVDSLMRRNVLSIPRGASVAQAAALMRQGGVGCVIVTQGDAPVGILTERDVTYRVVAEGRDPGATRVEEAMTQPLATIAPSASVEEAAERMRALRVKRLVVVMDGIVRGIVTVTDIAYAEPQIHKGLIEGWVKNPWTD